MTKKRKASASSERDEELDAREEQLRLKIEQFELERSAYVGDARPDDLLRLNIGGTVKVSVRRKTLTCVPGSMIAAKFSGRWDDSMTKDEDGAFFIDHDYSQFGPILTFLRNKSSFGDNEDVSPPTFPEEKKHEKENFDRLVEYYGLTESMYPIILSPCDDGNVVFNKIYGLKGFIKGSGHFRLTSNGIIQDVKMIELKIHKSLQIEIDWINVAAYNPGSVAPDNIGITISDYPFIDNFRYGNSVPLPFCMRDYAEKSSSDSFKLRTEDYGKRWYIDGREFDKFFDDPLNGATKELRIRIVGEGDFEVTDFALGDNSSCIGHRR